MAEALAALPAGVAPASIWLVEKGEASEQYSNGLRIDTTFAVAGRAPALPGLRGGPRNVAETFDKPGRASSSTPRRATSGPSTRAYNENLRDSSHDLLRYLKSNRVYNYLIDRFGRVYRVVDEETKANHAGHSVWTDERAPST